MRCPLYGTGEDYKGISVQSSYFLIIFDSVPTTLSYEMLTKFLREEIGFKGLIISDGMEMKAILDHYGLVDGTIMALNAGCDILLLCHEYEYQKLSLDTVKEAVKDGRISIDLLKVFLKYSSSKLASTMSLDKIISLGKSDPDL